MDADKVARLTKQIEDFNASREQVQSGYLSGSAKGRARVNTNGKTVDAQIVSGGERPGSIGLLKGGDGNWYGFGETNRVLSNTTLRHYRRKDDEVIKTGPNIPILFTAVEPSDSTTVKLYIGGAHKPVLLKTYTRIGSLAADTVSNYSVMAIARLDAYNYSGDPPGFVVMNYGTYSLSVAVPGGFVNSASVRQEFALGVGSYTPSYIVTGTLQGYFGTVSSLPQFGYVSTYKKTRFVFFQGHTDGQYFADYWIGNNKGQYTLVGIGSLSDNDWRRHHATIRGPYRIEGDNLVTIQSDDPCVNLFSLGTTYTNIPNRENKRYGDVSFDGDVTTSDTSASFKEFILTRTTSLAGPSCVSSPDPKEYKAQKVYKLKDTNVSPTATIRIISGAPSPV